jgi:hypothetical protein
MQYVWLRALITGTVGGAGGPPPGQIRIPLDVSDAGASHDRWRLQLEGRNKGVLSSSCHGWTLWFGVVAA